MNKKIIVIIFVFSGIVITAPFLIYFINFNGHISNNDQNWANFSTFIGGITSSIFSFFSFSLLIYTLLQDRELNRKDEVENRFFKYIDLIKLSQKNCSVEFDGYIKIKKYGIELFDDFGSLCCQVLWHNGIYDISIKKQRSKNEQEKYRNFYLQYMLEKAALKSHMNLIKIVLAYISTNGNEKEDEYISIFDTQLSVKEKAIFALLNREIIKGEKYEKYFLVNGEFLFNDTIRERIKFIVNNYGK